MGAVVTAGAGGKVAIIRDGFPSLKIKQDGNAGVVIKLHEPLPAYTGPTTVTPSQETQVLNTAALSVYEDITVNPIPSNYGLITWNGSVLTVS